MKIYLVGGAVRDKLLNIEVYENDWVVVGASENELTSKGYKKIGKDFPVFLHPETKEEYALARKERKSGTGHKGFKFKFDSSVSLEEDLLRRDLTVNAIAKDSNGELIDPYNGIEDLNNRILRKVSSAFEEDPLRVLRVARFASKLKFLGFEIEDETLNLMSKISSSGEIETLSKERIWLETSKALSTKNPEVFFSVLDEVGCLQRIVDSVSINLKALEDVSEENLIIVSDNQIHNSLKISKGLDTGLGGWFNMLLMLSGIYSLKTIKEVIRGYTGDRKAKQLYSEFDKIDVLKFLNFSGNSFSQVFGDGYLRPFELATFRLNNMNEIIQNWGDYILHAKYLPQRGASFLLNDKNQVIYKFFSNDVLGYSSNMRDPLKFLFDLIKE